MLNWILAGIVVVLWGFAVIYGIRSTRQYMKGNEDRQAKEAMEGVALSEEKTLEVMQRYPRSPRPAFAYATHAQRRGDHEEALRRFRVAIARGPDDHLAYVGTAILLRDLKRLDAAEVFVRKAIERFPEVKDLEREWAMIAHAREDWPEAASRWAAYRESAPSDRIGFEKGLEALLKLGQTDQAERLIAEASSRFTNFAAPAPTGG